MTTKKILITGIGGATTEESIHSWLGYFGSVLRVNIIRDGDAEHPVALVEMDISEGAVSFLVNRLSNYWHEGAVINAQRMNH